MSWSSRPSTRPSPRSPSPLPPPSVEETYRAYSRDPRKRRKWAADNPGNIAIRAELLDAVLELAAEPLEGEGAILDVGCGGGWLLAELAGAGVDPGRLLGVDLIPERVAAARERVPRADLRRADARELPFEDGAFSLVTLLSCLSSMPERGDVDRALAEVSRVSAPGGLVLCYEPWLANPLNPATSRVAGRTLERSLGPASASPRLTGFPPLARRLGRFAPRLYPTLARHAPTHRLTAHERGGARRPRG